MVAFLLKDICFYFTKGINTFWNTKYRDKKICVILLMTFIAASMISREKYFFCMSAIYLFLFVGVGCVYDNWLTDIFCKKEKSGKLLLKNFSHKAYMFGLFCGTLMITASMALCMPYIEFMLVGEFLPSAYLVSFTPIWYMMLVIFNILWFSYHILIQHVNILLADVYLNLYTAIISTVSIILTMMNIVSLKEVVLILLLMFSWGKYIISARKYSEDIGKNVNV